MQGIWLPAESSVTVPSSLLTPGGRDVVILRESEVGGDLADAIARVRADRKTARSQILIIAAEAGDSRDQPPVAERAAEPGNGAGVEAQATPFALDHSDATSSSRATARWGARLTHLVDDLEQFLRENQREVDAMAEAISEGTRAQLQHRTQVLSDIVSWTRAVATDLRTVSGAMLRGRLPVDLADLVEEFVAQRDGAMEQVRLAVEPALGGDEFGTEVDTDPPAARRLLQHAARLLADRVGATGGVAISVHAEREAVHVTLRGRGKSLGVGKTRAAQVRHMAERLGVAVRGLAVERPDESSLVLSFPSHRLT